MCAFFFSHRAFDFRETTERLRIKAAFPPGVGTQVIEGPPPWTSGSGCNFQDQPSGDSVSLPSPSPFQPAEFQGGKQVSSQEGIRKGSPSVLLSLCSKLTVLWSRFPTPVTSDKAGEELPPRWMSVHWRATQRGDHDVFDESSPWMVITIMHDY